MCNTWEKWQYVEDLYIQEAAERAWLDVRVRGQVCVCWCVCVCVCMCVHVRVCAYV